MSKERISESSVGKSLRKIILGGVVIAVSSCAPGSSMRGGAEETSKQPTPIATKTIPTYIPELTPIATVGPVVVHQAEPTPTAATSRPAAQPVLKYDEEGCVDQEDYSDCLTEGQVELASWPVRRAQEAVWGAATNEEAQAAMAEAMVAIQQMGASVGAVTFEGDPLELDFGTTYLVWCSNASEAEVPADVAMPLRPDHLGWGQLYIWVPPAHYADAPDPSLRSFSDCVDSKFWAVALR